MSEGVKWPRQTGRSQEVKLMRWTPWPRCSAEEMYHILPQVLNSPRLQDAPGVVPFMGENEEPLTVATSRKGGDIDRFL